MSLLLRWSLRAQKDVSKIRIWYQKKAGDKVSARIVTDIVKTVDMLTKHPNLGHIEPDLKSFPQSFRTYVLAPNYKIIYWLEDNFVKIATVFDCRQKPEELVYIINTKTDWVCEPRVEYGKINQ